MTVRIRSSKYADSQAIADVALAAFGDEEGPEIAALVFNLLADASAEPMQSLVAVIGGEVVGHVLFTNAAVLAQDNGVPAAILAPLAVLPEVQSRGIGGQLIREGLSRLSEAGVGLVFVLGHPSYYPRYGFSPAGALSLEAPYPIPAENADAWMVQSLRPGLIGRVKGQVKCADALNDLKYWRE